MGDSAGESRRSRALTLPVAADLVEGHKDVDNWRATHVNSPTMGDSRPVKAARLRLALAAVAWAEAVDQNESASQHGTARVVEMLLEMQAAARSLRDAIATQGRPQ